MSGIRGEDWSAAEVGATVDDYFSMLEMELRGVPFVKAEHRCALTARLASRSEKSVEFKYQNVSAVLDEMRLPFIDGYKPMRNVQNLLRNEVADWLARHPLFTEIVQEAALSVPEMPALDDIRRRFSRIVTSPPVVRDSAEPDNDDRVSGDKQFSLPAQVDYAALEAANRRLGKRGEEFVCLYEQERLLGENRADLADQVEWVARTRGDGLGYDIASFTEQGMPLCIEVKTTYRGASYPFLVTRNEMQASDHFSGNYRLYRVYSFARDPRLFILSGSLVRLEQQNRLFLIPQLYRARLGG